MKQYTKLDVVKKIVGEISSIGSSHIDEERLENLEEFAWIISEYIELLLEECQKIHRPQASMQKSGRKALDIIQDLYWEIRNILELLEVEE